MLNLLLRKQFPNSLLRGNLNSTLNNANASLLLLNLKKSLYSTTSTANNPSIDYSKLNYFQLFPITFPKNGPPQDSFIINLRTLKKEYLKLQQSHHPDLIKNLDKSTIKQASASHEMEDDENSKLFNKAYSTLKSPLTRAQYILQLHGIDITSDEINNKYKQLASNDKELLMMILETHEQLENCKDFEELKGLKLENDNRIKQSEKTLNELFLSENYDEAASESIKLNYWINLKIAIRDWEPGAPVNLTH